MTATTGIASPSLGAQPFLGRAVHRERGKERPERAAVLTDSLWRDQFGGRN